MQCLSFILRQRRSKREEEKRARFSPLSLPSINQSIRLQQFEPTIWYRGASGFDSLAQKDQARQSPTVCGCVAQQHLTVWPDRIWWNKIHYFICSGCAGRSGGSLQIDWVPFELFLHTLRLVRRGEGRGTFDYDPRTRILLKQLCVSHVRIILTLHPQHHRLDTSPRPCSPPPSPSPTCQQLIWHFGLPSHYFSSAKLYFQLDYLNFVFKNESLLNKDYNWRVLVLFHFIFDIENRQIIFVFLC